MAIPVIDIFAGPGGLGEGFSSVIKWNKRVFDVRLSIEMDANAHKTLELRSFFRKFPVKKAPSEYYDMIMEADPDKREQLREQLFEKYKDQAQEAKEEAWCAELGHKDFPPELIDSRIEKALNGATNWVLIGGPPCQAYSLVGRSRRQWGDQLDNEDKRVHLYKEYLRIIAEHHPAVFVMENVKGLLSSVLDGEKMFDLIKRDLRDPSSVFTEKKSPGYKIFSLTTEATEYDNGHPVYNNDTDYLIRSEEYGVPQKRHRVILLGIREDISVIPGILNKSEKPVTLTEIIGDLPKIRSGINRSFERSEIVKGKKKRIYRNEHDSDKNWLKLINSFRKEIISWNGFAKDYSSAGITTPGNGIGSEFVPCKTPSKENPLFTWYHDPEMKGAANHESRSHLVEDLKRYMFSSMFTKTYKRFPRLHEFEKHSVELLPDHENAKSGKFADRFRVQVPDQPATTVTSHISKDGHYFIHYDPDQCRSLTVREAARIQTFPDNYLFCGSRTAQYHQVGNAVPPYLAVQIAQVVLNVLDKWK
ncbi:DNA cytosine methyltransferase [Roseivirga sp. UBA1976]|uniref:DNA cytosine methyltransferase n=1 Tax=Roseivirga sp. UBA1976 TaxID=1947386 RepID=UPI00257C059A|nr:DNA cytosine methyltransferase [Roseivirga sp. UBA1976]MEC7756023.1 DNA cytosine methyltransferase [Bacteroidota bacterium]|tara:strand:- start:6736 stop:8331 length:1596 start_codon:yes stop_codon:yes gene_type:complete